MKVFINIKVVDPEEASMEDLFMVRNQLGVIDAGYQDTKLPTPEWVIDKLTDIDREVTNRARAELTRQLKAALARDAALKPKGELRKDIQTEIAELQKRLA